MVFTDLLFLFCFLPISVLLYKVAKNIKIQNILLVVLSLLFYAWGNPVHVILLILSILWNYFTALELNEQEDEKARKIILIVGFCDEYPSYSIKYSNCTSSRTFILYL